MILPLASTVNREDASRPLQFPLTQSFTNRDDNDKNKRYKAWPQITAMIDKDGMSFSGEITKEGTWL